MTPVRRRLVALAAALAPGRARALLARLGDDEAGAAVALAVELARAPRRARLAAVAAALPACAHPSPGAGHPLLERLRLEARLAGSPAAAPTSSPGQGSDPVPSEARTMVRRAAAPPRPSQPDPP